MEENIGLVGYFEHADTERFNWLTKNRCMVMTEKTLLEEIDSTDARSVLEVGCGEGANIYNLRNKAKVFFGVDLSYEKLKFAKVMIGQENFICADASDLPFKNNCFELVFCKDVLHHVRNKNRMVEEMIRVCSPSGKIIVIESNGRNFFWFLFGTIVGEEKNVKNNKIEEIAKLLYNFEGKLSKISIDSLYTPMLVRLMIHYKFGLERIGNTKFFLFLVKSICRSQRLVARKRFWAYIVATGVKKS